MLKFIIFTAVGQMVWLVRLFARLNYNSDLQYNGRFSWATDFNLNAPKQHSAQMHYVMEMPKTTLFSLSSSNGIHSIRFSQKCERERERGKEEKKNGIWIWIRKASSSSCSNNSVSFIAACRICRPLQLYLLISGLSAFFLFIILKWSCSLCATCFQEPIVRSCFVVVLLHNAHGSECALFVGLWMTEMGFERFWNLSHVLTLKFSNRSMGKKKHNIAYAHTHKQRGTLHWLEYYRYRVNSRQRFWISGE